jgi:hypothetical protein
VCCAEIYKKKIAMKQIRVIITVLLAGILYACPSYDDEHECIYFINKSSTNLRYQMILGNKVMPEDRYINVDKFRFIFQ